MPEMDKLDLLEGMDGADLVQETFLFKDLGFEEATSLAGAFQKCSFPDGEEIIQEEAIGDALYLVRAGTVTVEKSDGTTRRVLRELSEGELFGEMSLIEATLTSASVIAKGDVECLKLDRKDLDAMMQASPEFASKIYKAFCGVLSDRLRRTTQELFELQIRGEG